jgi:hypothetical protein
MFNLLTEVARRRGPPRLTAPHADHCSEYRLDPAIKKVKNFGHLVHNADI